VRDLWVSVRAHCGPLVLALAVTLVASVAALAQPLAARTVVDALSTGATLSGALLVLSGLVLLSAAATGLGSWILDRTGEHVVRDVRRHGASPLVLTPFYGADLDSLDPNWDVTQ